MSDAQAIPLLLEHVQSNAWAMEPVILDRMLGVFERHLNGVKLSESEILAVTEGRDKGRPRDSEGYHVVGRTAVIPISGVIAKHSRMINGSSQPRGTSTETVRDDLSTALGDPRVERIALHIESPGGTISGVPDLADAIAAANAQKPVTAYIDELGASAAYWLASQASAIYANQSAAVGSIGVYTVLADSSEAAAKMGVKFHLVRSGPHKGTGTPGVAITAEQLEAVQSDVDRYASMFRGAVQRGRKMSAEQVAAVSTGRVFVAADAAANGLIEGVATWDDVLNERIPGRRGGSASASASPSGAASTQHEETRMPEKDTAAQQAALEAAKSEGAKAERERIAAIDQALAGDAYSTARAEAISKGLDLTGAKALAFEAANTQVKSLGEQLAVTQKKLTAAATGGLTPVAQDAKDDQKVAEAQKKAAEELAAKGSDKACEFDAKVEALVKAGNGKVSKFQAVSDVAASDPALHAAWIERANAGRKQQ